MLLILLNLIPTILSSARLSTRWSELDRSPELLANVTLGSGATFSVGDRCLIIIHPPKAVEGDSLKVSLNPTMDLQGELNVSSKSTFDSL